HDYSHLHRDNRRQHNSSLARRSPPALALYHFHTGARRHRAIHSFPTRRSSDLQTRTGSPCTRNLAGGAHSRGAGSPLPGSAWGRSEEHTSELQSRENRVCRLLLEKYKNGFEVLVCLGPSRSRAATSATIGHFRL